jgi:hypothetical protein
MGKFTTFERELRVSEPDMPPILLDGLGPTLVFVEDNGGGGITKGAPVYLAIKRDGRTITSSLTLDETVRLRNILNEAIVWAEGVLAQ